MNKKKIEMIGKILLYLTVLVCSVLVLQEQVYAQKKLTTIVIDPGHGGEDPGAVGKTSYEKNVVLKISKKFGSYIKKNFPEVKVLYTRDADQNPTLRQRTIFANQNNADIFISIHANSVKYNCETVFGFESFVMGIDKNEKNYEVVKNENSVILKEADYKKNYDGFDPNDPETMIIFSLNQSVYIEQSIKLCDFMQKYATKDIGRYDRKVKQAPFWVLWAVNMPSILVELGFICNSDEEAYLNSEIGQENFARALYNGFVDYKSFVDEQIYNKKMEYLEEVIAEIYKDTTLKVKKEQVEPIKQKQEITTQPQNPINPKQDSTILKEQTIINNTNNNKKDTTINTTNNINTITQQNETKYPTDKLVFKVQIVTSSKQLSSNSSVFKGYSGVDVYFHQGLYKYTLGEETDFDKIQEFYNKIKNDFHGCFIIVFKNGQRIK